LSLSDNFGLITLTSSSLGISFSSTDSASVTISVVGATVVGATVVTTTVVDFTASIVVGSGVVDFNVVWAIVVTSGVLVVSGTASTASGTNALCLLEEAFLPWKGSKSENLRLFFSAALERAAAETTARQITNNFMLRDCVLHPDQPRLN